MALFPVPLWEGSCLAEGVSGGERNRIDLLQRIVTDYLYKPRGVDTWYCRYRDTSACQPGLGSSWGLLQGHLGWKVLGKLVLLPLFAAAAGLLPGRAAWQSKLASTPALVAQQQVSSGQWKRWHLVRSHLQEEKKCKILWCMIWGWFFCCCLSIAFLHLPCK